MAMINNLVFLNDNEHGYVSVKDDGNHLRFTHNELGLVSQSAFTRDEALAAAHAIIAYYEGK